MRFIKWAFALVFITFLAAPVAHAQEYQIKRFPWKVVCMSPAVFTAFVKEQELQSAMTGVDKLGDMHALFVNKDGIWMLVAFHSDEACSIQGGYEADVTGVDFSGQS